MTKLINHRAQQGSILTGLLLLTLLIVTRSDMTRSHFGTSLNPPDASWAVFWLAGTFSALRWWPLALLFACAAVDYLAVATGTRADCFTPAYPFLIPAYLSLWMMGRWSSGRSLSKMNSWAWLGLSIVSGVTTCFTCANAGMYVASGQFSHLSPSAYLLAVIGYWPDYLLSTAIYSGIGLLLFYGIKHLHLSGSLRKSI